MAPEESAGPPRSRRARTSGSLPTVVGCVRCSPTPAAEAGSRRSRRRRWEAHYRGLGDPGRRRRCAGFDLDAWFGRGAAERDGLIVEIGSGVGEATAALAAARPSYDVLALEVWRPGIAATLGRLAEAGAENVRLCGVDAAVWSLAASPRESRSPSCGPSSPTHGTRPGTTSGAWCDPGFAGGGRPAAAPGGVWRLGDGLGRLRRPDGRGARRRAGAGPVAIVERWTERPVTKFERKGRRRAGRSSGTSVYRRVDATVGSVT